MIMPGLSRDSFDMQLHHLGLSNIALRLLSR